MMAPAGPLLVMVGIGALAALLAAVVVTFVRRRAGRAAAGTAPGCAACGYDTTGLTSLTCPECGADLRAVGISRSPPGSHRRDFAAAAVSFVALWNVSGLMLAALVNELVPTRREYTYEVRLTAPSYGAYGAVVVKARGAAWGRARPSMSVRVDLEPPASGGAPPPAPPPPLAVDPRTGAYNYADAAGNRVSQPSGFDAQAVIAWLGSAGVNTSDARVRVEAREVWLSALRAGRVRRTDAVGSSSGTSTAGSTRGPFASTRFTESSRPGENRWAALTRAAVWLLVLAIGLTHLWRLTAPPRHRPFP